MESEKHPEGGSPVSTPPRARSTPVTGHPNQVPVITRHNSLPTTPVPPPSLEWDRSCLQDPFLAGQQFLGGIERLNTRKRSATDPNLVDNNQVLLVSTDYSSLGSSLEQLIESAGKISSSIMPETAMENEADDIFAEIDALISSMTANSASRMNKYVVDTYFSRLENMADDLQGCLRLFNSWKRKYKNEVNADLKKQVEEEVDKVTNTFQTYSDSLAEKRDTFQLEDPPPASRATSVAGQEMISHLQQETKCDRALQVNTKKLQIQRGIEELLKEVRMWNWKDVEDSKIQKAMSNIAGWKVRKLKIGENFQDFEGMITTWEPTQLVTDGSDFKILQLEVEDFDTNFSNAIYAIEKQDIDRNLGSLEKAPTSLMDYPPFAGLDSSAT